MPFTRAMIGAFDVDLTHEFFQGFVNHALVTLHVDNLRGAERAPSGRDGVQGVRPRAARWRSRRIRARRGVDAVDQGDALSCT